jgi:hypothetical protein
MTGLNQYSELLIYLKGLGVSDTYINVVTKGENIELDKMTVFPSLHIDINSGTFPSSGTIQFTVELSCWDIRDINKEVNDDKFWSNDNETDNLNNTLAALNRIWRIMNRDFNENNITASDNPSIEAVKFDKKNLLDGWVMSFDVEMPNTTISLC